MIKRDDIIKHKNSKDIAAAVLYIYEDDTAWVSWINLGFVHSWYIDRYDYISIDNNWLVCQDSGIDCLRYAKWS